MEILLLLLALIIKWIPACNTCGLGWLTKPFSLVHQAPEQTGDTLVVTVNESAWTIRDLLVIALLSAAALMCIFNREDYD